jgi:hypothetical protein
MRFSPVSKQPDGIFAQKHTAHVLLSVTSCYAFSFCVLGMWLLLQCDVMYSVTVWGMVNLVSSWWICSARFLSLDINLEDLNRNTYRCQALLTFKWTADELSFDCSVLTLTKHHLRRMAFKSTVDWHKKKPRQIHDKMIVMELCKLSKHITLSEKKSCKYMHDIFCTQHILILRAVVNWKEKIAGFAIVFCFE